MHDLHISIVRLSEGDELGAIMSRLRTWLDGQKIQPATFKTFVDAKGYLLENGFRTTDEAGRFRAQFSA